MMRLFFVDLMEFFQDMSTLYRGYYNESAAIFEASLLENN